MTDPVRNEVSAPATTVVQAGTITGDVHLGLSGRPVPTARVVAAWHPFDLDVHPAITVGAGRLPDLPPYVRRAHDDELDALLGGLAGPVMAVLTGESSTGKTRALYEAVLRHFPEWPVVYPRTADDLLALLRAGVGSRTVLWLNETQNHLTEEAASGLRGLLEGPAPVAVLGTLWPEYWARFMAEPSHVRSLLQHRVSRVRVRSTFSPELVAAARTSNDPRLRRAVTASAADGKVIQTMSGGPALVERYEHPDTSADRYATAIVTAALDARRLGHRSLLTRAFLVDAAPGYLADEDRVDAPEDWFELGLTVATQDRTGIAALLPKRLSPGIGPADAYDTHDYLDQYARTTRRWALTPISLWDALVTYSTNPEDQFRLCHNALHRLRYHHGETLYRAAVSRRQAAPETLRLISDHGMAEWEPSIRSEANDFAGWVWGDRVRADHLADAGRWAEALEVARARTAPWVEGWIAERLAKAGNVAMLRRLAATGSFEAVMRLAEHELAAGRVEAGLTEVDRLRGHLAIPSQRLLVLLLGAAQENRARAIAPRSDAGVQVLAKALVEVDRRAEAIELLRDHVDGADADEVTRMHEVYVLLADLLVDAGRGDEALELCRVSENWPAVWLARRLARAGNVDKLRAMADLGLEPAQIELAALLAERGRFAELEDRTRRGDEHAAKRLVALGRADLYDLVSDRSRSGSR
ncbi:MAG: hypothetical protein HOY78_15045 [Saccharothrix sp.]|nr:hypothetical protein [Saccharothrix sp.]